MSSRVNIYGHGGYVMTGLDLGFKGSGGCFDFLVGLYFVCCCLAQVEYRTTIRPTI